MGDIAGKTLIDVGCANGFFAQSFIMAGGKSAVGVDTDPNWRKDCPKDITVYESIADVTGHYDYCLFLDLYYDSAVNSEYLQWCKERADVCFISPSGDGRKNNARLYNDLVNVFVSVKPLELTHYAHRMIYKCA